MSFPIGFYLSDTPGLLGELPQKQLQVDKFAILKLQTNSSSPFFAETQVCKVPQIAPAIQN